MGKFYPLLLALFCIATFHAQTSERTIVPGVVTAPVGDDVEGVHIFNKSINKGTVTDASGAFELLMGRNDHIVVTALQYQTFTVIVDEETILKNNLKIYLNPAINELEEVVIRPHSLTGNLKIDAENIDTYVFVPNWDLSYETIMNDYEFAPDRLSKIQGNAAEDALGLNKMPVASLDFVKVAELIFPKRKKSKGKAEKLKSRSDLFEALQNHYSDSFLWTTFGIPKEKAKHFLYYTIDNGLKSEWLTDENALLLFEFMLEQSEAYAAVYLKTD
ncbi:carboxypeptidase-like regulatory domain-containing protein [Luteirhabdus pelagi]|uniref:carboxypeptidase-like regulatory domain-containing protein n=1 Tax=Luteirhabdus pelagi TaxID=2792783 RepID=UPI001939BA75|nr:carboxypeptidase-like regulatory domain-containing protein [Luteirhabdus pelagi]